MTDEERIDLVLSEMARNKDGRLDIQKYLKEELKEEDNHAYKRAISTLVDEGYIKKVSPQYAICDILSKGREIVKAGGGTLSIN
jgi:hypothetical protein